MLTSTLYFNQLQAAWATGMSHTLIRIWHHRLYLKKTEDKQRTGNWKWHHDGAGSLYAFLFVFDGDSEAFLQQWQLTDQVSDSVRERFLWAVVRCGLHSDDDLVLQRMRNFITSKQNLRVLQQLNDSLTEEYLRISSLTLLTLWSGTGTAACGGLH